MVKDTALVGLWHYTDEIIKFDSIDTDSDFLSFRADGYCAEVYHKIE